MWVSNANRVNREHRLTARRSARLLEGFRDVRAYHRSFCAAAYDGTISCIGGPDTEQFGEAGRAFRDEFERNQAAPDGVLFKQSALGLLHGCALSQNGRIYCWGRNSFGQVTGLVANQVSMPRLSESITLRSGTSTSTHLSA